MYKMDRRQFLKAGALGAGAITLGQAIPSEAKTKAVTGHTPLEVKGYVAEPARQIPVVDTADVVVVGGGPAGVAAAIAAARQGVDVLIMEREYFLGGLFTGCGVTPIINMFSPDPAEWRKQAVRGICDELVQRLDNAKMLNLDHIRPKADPEAAKYFLEEMIAEAGVRVLYGVHVSQIIKSGDKIEAVILEGKSGRVAVKTGFVVDCSGDGDILEFSGEDFTAYHDNIGAMWRIGNAENCSKGTPTAIKGVKTMHKTGERDQDGLDMYNLTRIQLRIRKEIWDQAMNLRQQEGCGDLYLVDSPSVVGVRITRVLNSLFNVTTEGALTGANYDDVIGFTGADSAVTWNGEKYPSKSRKMWQVPYRSLVPKTIGNLLVAGRCFGFERPLTYDAREVGTCFMTGQAAGTAAGISVFKRISSRDVDIKELQTKLRKQNVKLDW